MEVKELNVYRCPDRECGCDKVTLSDVSSGRVTYVCPRCGLLFTIYIEEDEEET